MTEDHIVDANKKVSKGIRLHLTTEQEVALEFICSHKRARPADLEQRFKEVGLQPLKGPLVAALLAQGPLVEAYVGPRSGTCYIITKDGRKAVGRA